MSNVASPKTNTNSNTNTSAQGHGPPLPADRNEDPSERIARRLIADFHDGFVREED